jgi:hypothetical protein
MIAAATQSIESHEPGDTLTSTEAPTSTNAPVTIDPRAILDAFLSRALPLPDLANHFNISITKLIEILSTPQSQQQLEAAKQLADLQYHLLHQQAKAAALETLTQIATDTNADPTERRRAAAAILRPQRTRSRPGSPPPSPSENGAGEAPSAARRRGSSAPAQTFPPQSSHNALIEHALAALADTDLTPANAIAQLHPHFHPAATINNHPIPQSPQDFDETLAFDLTHCVQYFAKAQELSEHTAHHRIIFVHQGGRCLYVNLDTAKQPDNTWRITNITTEPINSS